MNLNNEMSVKCNEFNEWKYMYILLSSMLANGTAHKMTTNNLQSVSYLAKFKATYHHYTQ